MDTVDQTVESGQRETFPISGTRADNTSSTSFEREPFRNIKIKNIVINHHRLADAITGGEPATGKQKEAHLGVTRLTIKFNKTFFLNESSKPLPKISHFRHLANATAEIQHVAFDDSSAFLVGKE